MTRTWRRGSALIEYILLAAIGTAAIFTSTEIIGARLADVLSAIADTLAAF